MLRSVWDLPGPGLEPVSPALAGGFLTTAPPGKPHSEKFNKDLEDIKKNQTEMKDTIAEMKLKL